MAGSTAKRGAALVLFVLVVAAALIAWRRRPTEAANASDAAAPVAARASTDVIPIDPTSKGGLDIEVLSASGPAAGAIVALHSTSLRKLLVADANGRIAAPDLPMGKYRVDASAPDGVATKEAVVVPGVTAKVELRLVPIEHVVTLRGKVRDSLGGVVAGAEVWVGGGEGQGTVVVRSDAAGTFAARIAAGSHSLLVRAPGYADSYGGVGVTSDLEVEVWLHAASSIRGVVVHRDGKPASGARVLVERRFAHRRSEAFAGADGSFTIDGLEAATYRLLAATPGESNYVDAINLPPATFREVRVVLESATSVFGRVIDEEGNPIADADVMLAGGDPIGHPRGKTNAKGEYRFDTVLMGPVVVNACAALRVCANSDAGFIDGVSPAKLNVVLRPGAVLRVHVVDAQGQPLAGAYARLAHWVDQCRTDATGTCAIEHLTTRKSTLHVSHATAGNADAEDIVIAAGIQEKTVRLDAGMGTVRGTVRWDDGKIAADVHVTSLETVTRTGPDGRYELMNVPPGDHFIHAEQALALGGDRELEQTTRAVHRNKRVSVRRGETVEGVNLVLPRREKRISGTVIGADGAPVAYASVGAVRDENGMHASLLARAGLSMYSPATYARADGTFTIEDLEAGKHTVWADADGQARATLSVDAGTENAVVKLPAFAVVRGRVVNARGEPLKSFVVRVDHRYPEHRVRVSNPDGRFTLDTLSAGDHSIAIEGVTKETRLLAHAEVELAAGESKEVSLVVKQGLTIGGRLVQWPSMTPTPGITIETGGSFSRESDPTDADGNFWIENVLPGTVKLSANDVGGEREEWTREVEDEDDHLAGLGDLAYGARAGQRSTYSVKADSSRYLVYHEEAWSEYRPPVQVNDEVESVDGHPVGALGVLSLEHLLATAGPKVPVVLGRGDGDEVPTHDITVYRTAPRKKTSVDDPD